MRIRTLQQNKPHQQTRIEKAIPLFSHTALSQEENLAGSWMDLCNVKQNELVDGKDRFCIVGLYLDDTEPKLGYTC